METRDRGEQKKPCCYFTEIQKALVLNKTNWNIISKAYGDESDDWPGKPIVLFVAEVDSFGDIVQAIRVRPPAKPRRGPAPKAAAATAAEPEPDKAAVQTYWRTAKGFGLNQKQGLKILEENGGDFVKATAFLEADNAMPD